MREIDVCVKENYTSEVLLICVFIALLWGAGNNLATPPGQNCGLQVVEQFFFVCGKQITRILSEEMKVSGHDRVQW